MEGVQNKMERFFLYDDVEDTKTRFVSFAGKTQRYDLAVLQSSRFFGKVLVLDIQFGRFAIIGADDVEEIRILRTCIQPHRSRNRRFT